jgi:hypothetical protein
MAKGAITILVYCNSTDRLLEVRYAETPTEAASLKKQLRDVEYSGMAVDVKVVASQ